MSSAPRPNLILMFHGLSAEGADLSAADPHYTLPARRFADQLDALKAEGLRLGCARDLIGSLGRAAAPALMLTFDDGDASNYQQAFPLLRKRALSADFFVNPARVGQPGFCSWEQLREMAEAGMSIQSHGHTHRYFTALSAAELREELRVSKAEIEQRIGQPVSLLAPPGGRSPIGLSALARELGYRAVLGSAPGAVAANALAEAAETPLPRLALTHAHTPEQVLSWSRAADALRPLQQRYRRLALAKRVLGDRGYEQLRGFALGLLTAAGRAR